jgi:hypothetical protein
MIVTVQVDGGFAFFPKLNAAKTLDTATLSADEKTRLESLIKEACAENFSKVLGQSPRHAADVRTFVVTVRDGDKTHQMRVTEPVTDKVLSTLLNFLLKRSNE